MDRVVRLERVPNLRDLGGLPAGNGRRVVSGRIFRSGSLHEMTEADRTALEALGVRIVIDLRSPFEQRHHPHSWPAGRLVLAPLADDGVVAAIFARFEAGTLSGREVEDWWQLTGVLDCPTRHAASIRTIFTTLLQAGPDDGVLYHCTGGKDRTGVVSALILEALGVAREVILSDFLLSNVDAEARAAEFLALLSRTGGSQMSAPAAFALAGVKEEWLDALFRRIAERFGSVESYLTDEVGIGTEGLAALRARYLEPAGA